MKRLIIGRIPDDFDPRNDIPLGPFCFCEREDVYPEWEDYPFLADPFPTPEELSKASRLTARYADFLIPGLSRHLNEVNGVERSQAFWRIMIYPWVIQFVQTIYERQTRLKQFIEKYGDQPLKVEIVSYEEFPAFSSCMDFVYNAVLNPEYNEWLYSRFIETIKPEKWSVEEKKLKKFNCKPLDIYGRAENGILSAIKKPLRKIKRQAGYLSRCLGVFGIGYLEQFLWSAWMSLFAGSTERDERPLDQNGDDAKIEFVLDAGAYILQSVPKLFTDLDSIDVLEPRCKKGGLRLIGPILYFTENEMYWAARCVEKGERLVSVQHGGLYGTAKEYSYVSEVEYRNYRFLSWGWSEHDGHKVNAVPIYSPQLARVHDKHRRVNDDLILVGTVAHLYPIRLNAVPQAVQGIQYRKSKIAFLNALDDAPKKNASYRPFFYSPGALADAEYVKKKIPGVRICEGDLHAQMLQCKMVVCDHPETTMIISLAADIPTITFWDESFWPMVDRFNQVKNVMMGAGLVFHDPVEAASRINDVWDDLDDWWSSADVQNARKLFLDNYGRVGKNWRLELARTLRGL